MMKTENVNESEVQDYVGSKHGKGKDKIGNEEYTEKIYSKWMTLVLGSTTAVFTFLGVYDILVGWEWSEPLPVWFWPLMAVSLLAITINYLRLTIKIDSEGITVGYGIDKSKLTWDDIDDCYLDETSELKYGWGFRITRVDGKWRSAYNVIRNPRVVVSLNKGWIREHVFPTSNPEKAMKTIEGHLNI